MVIFFAFSPDRMARGVGIVQGFKGVNVRDGGGDLEDRRGTCRGGA